MTSDDMRGLTLIETIIYLALYSVLLTSVIEFSCAIAQDVSHSSSRLQDEEAARFVAAKLSWTLSHAASVQVIPGNPSRALQVQLPEGSTEHFSIAGETIVMSTDGGTSTPITPSDVPAAFSLFRPNPHLVTVSGNVGTAAFSLNETVP